MTIEILKYFAFFIFFLEIGLFLFVIYAVIVKFQERIKEKKDDKYRDVKR